MRNEFRHAWRMFWSTTVAACVFGLVFGAYVLPAMIPAEVEWTGEGSTAQLLYMPPLLALLAGGAAYLVLYARDWAE